VGSVQTVAKRLELYNDFDLIIIDEAHHAVSPQYQKIIQANHKAKIIGFTATPARLDSKGLGKSKGGCFDALVMGPTIEWLTEKGFLVPARVFAPSAPDLSDVKKLAGDFQQGQLDKAMGKHLTGDAVSHYRRLCPSQPALAYCVSVAHADRVAEAFRADGWRAVSVSGSSSDEDRDGAFAGLANGTIDVVASCDLVSEGLDVPNVRAIILLRPTASLCLHVQQIGRGLRPMDGKLACIVLDHAGNTARHGLPDECHEWSLEGRKTSDKPKPMTVAQCPNCFAMHRPKPVCPECGHLYKVAKQRKAPMQVIDAELAEVIKVKRMELLKNTPIEQLVSEAITLQNFQDIAKAKGYKSGWAFHKWSSKNNRDLLKSA
jgi:superfamily II DNA or RNA helicase